MKEKRWSMKTVILTGGGTAGHVMPCLAIVPALKKYFDRILYIGGEGMEKEIVPKVLPYYSVPTTKLYRTEIYKNVKIPFVLARGVAAAKDILVKTEPCVLFSKGGYAALPACLAAKTLQIPVVCHESDYTLGLANKWTARFAKLVLTSFIETRGGVYVGNPVRNEILSGNREKAIQKYRISRHKPVLLVVGGSSGSSALNEVLYAGLDRFTQDYFVVHISGKSGDLSKKHADYLQIPYAEDLPDLFAASDVVVSRGGSNALSELAALGKNAVIVPLPKGNSRGDQILNARSYERRGFFTVLPQEDLFVESLLDRIEKCAEITPNKLDVAGINETIARKIAEVARVL